MRQEIRVLRASLAVSVLAMGGAAAFLELHYFPRMYAQQNVAKASVSVSCVTLPPVATETLPLATLGRMHR